MDPHLIEDVRLQLSGPETIRRGVIKKERHSKRGEPLPQNFRMHLNVFTDVGLIIIALGHLRQLFLQDHIQGNAIWFKPGNKCGAKSLMHDK